MDTNENVVFWVDAVTKWASVTLGTNIPPFTEWRVYSENVLALDILSKAYLGTVADAIIKKEGRFYFLTWDKCNPPTQEAIAKQSCIIREKCERMVRDFEAFSNASRSKVPFEKRLEMFRLIV